MIVYFRLRNYLLLSVTSIRLSILKSTESVGLAE